MKQLLAGRLDPLTFSIGFVEAPLQQIAESIHRDHLRFSPEACLQALSGSLEAMLHTLEPLTVPAYRTLIVGTHSNWTAYFLNHINGDDLLLQVSLTAEALGCRGVVATKKADIADSPADDVEGLAGSVSFALFGPGEAESFNLVRKIMVENYRKWTFETIGSPQPFEDTNQYKKRKVQERFTPEMLDQYCEAMGIQLADEKFYSSEGRLLGVLPYTPPNVYQLSLAEARKLKGLPLTNLG
jgi:hypothetical protein